MSHNFKKPAPVGKQARAEAAIGALARTIPDLNTVAWLLEQSSDPEAMLWEIRPYLKPHLQWVSPKTDAP